MQISYLVKNLNFDKNRNFAKIEILVKNPNFNENLRF